MRACVCAWTCIRVCDHDGVSEDGGGMTLSASGWMRGVNDECR